MREARSTGQGAGRGAFRQRRREKRGGAHGVLSDLTASLVPPSPRPSMRPLLQPPDMSSRCPDIPSCFTSSSSWSTIFQLGASLFCPKPPSFLQSQFKHPYSAGFEITSAMLSSCLLLPPS